MNDFEVSKNITRPVRGAIIVMLVLAFIVLFIPLWQQGQASAIPVSMIKADAKSAELDKEGRAIRAALAAGIITDAEQVIVSAGNGYQS